MKKLLALSLALIMVFCMFGAASASAEYPSDSIVCIVPFDPGGSNDTLTRALLQYIDLPVPMVVTNISGANGLVGAQEGFRATPDGYTILSANPGNLTTQELTFADNESLWKNLVPICTLACNYELVLGKKDAPFKTGEEFLAYAKDHPGEIKWGVAGAQSVQMGGAFAMMDAAGFECTMVPYDGGAASRTALQGGHIDALISNTTDAKELIETGDGIPLFVLTHDRCMTYPDVPTALEIGIDYFKSDDTRAYFAPPGTSDEIVQYLAAKMKEVSENEDFIAYLSTFGFDPCFMGPEEVPAHLQAVYDEQAPIYASFS